MRGLLPTPGSIKPAASAHSATATRASDGMPGFVRHGASSR